MCNHTDHIQTNPLSSADDDDSSLEESSALLEDDSSSWSSLEESFTVTTVRATYVVILFQEKANDYFRNGLEF